MRRTRVSKSRVRSGCGTCKIRHIRCDEAKPICANCASAGYDCEGYCYNTSVQRRPSNPFRIDIVNWRVPIPSARSNPAFTTLPLQNDNPPQQETLADSSRSGNTENVALSSELPLRLQSNESWVEAQSSSLSLYLSDAITTGLEIEQTPNPSPRHIQLPVPKILPQQQRPASSQEDEDFEVITSLNKHAIPTPPCRLAIQPSPGPNFENAIEHRCFTLFLESAATQLAGYHESSLWERIIPQVCHEEQWAMSAAIAIEALNQNHYIFALERYNDAIRQFNQKAKAKTNECLSETHVRLVLIFTLLTTYFETYIGNKEFAIQQVESGVGVLLQWAAERQKTPADETDEWSNVRHITSRSLCLEKDLLDAFQRLDHQVLLCRGFQSGRKAPQAYPTTRGPFSSVDEAERICSLAVQRVLYFHEIRNIREQHSAPCYDKKNAQTYLKHELSQFNIATEQFLRSFEPIFNISRQEPGSKEFLLANIVMIRAVACRFAISQGPSDSEMYTDSFLLDYKLINKLARELIESKSNFNFDMTLGASIFSLSHHCRDPAVRAAAIDLLHQCPERGWFDTRVAAEISKRLMSEETRGIVDGHIPDTARLRLIKHELGSHKRTAKFYCSWLVQRDTARKMLPPITITW